MDSYNSTKVAISRNFGEIWAVLRHGRAVPMDAEEVIDRELRETFLNCEVRAKFFVLVSFCPLTSQI